MTQKTPPKPGPTHPDVFILKALFLDMPTGGTLSYDDAAKSLGLSGSAEIFRRRADTARKQLIAEQAATIVCVRGDGFLRETPLQTIERTRQSTRPSIRRKARSIGRQLAGIDPGELSTDQRSEYFTERTVNNVVYVACSGATRKNILASTQQSNAVLPMAKALDALGGRVA